jgi:hypothetical protein
MIELRRLEIAADEGLLEADDGVVVTVRYIGWSSFVMIADFENGRNTAAADDDDFVV